MHELEESVSGSLRAIGEEVAPAAGLERRVADRVSRRERRRLAVAILAVVLILLAIGIALPLSQRHRSLPVPAAGVGQGAAVSPSRRATVRVIELNGVVDPLLASLVERGVDTAGRRGDAAVLLTIDTGGGLDSSTRRVVRAVLAAKVPVVCYTGPAGARAAAAGAFVMQACPLAAMAPGSSIGAAHPVGVAGSIEQAKVTNDAAAFMRALAARWGRNPSWAEQAVRDSVSATAERALALHAVDLLASSPEELLAKVDGRAVTASGRRLVLHTAGARLQVQAPGVAVALLHGLIDPNLAFLLFYLGIVLVVVEVLHPGASLPGLLGVLFLVVSALSFGLLPVQLGGLVLLLASVVLFLLELKHPAHGATAAGGVACLVLGGLLLFNPAVPSARVSPWLLVLLPALLVAFFGFVVRAVLGVRQLPALVEAQPLPGRTGIAVSALDPDGRVRVGHEEWSATATGGPLPAGTRVWVVHRAGLRLLVERAPGPPVEEPGHPTMTDLQGGA
jgi:membrane-bound serine protease (ClpP class)